MTQCIDITTQMLQFKEAIRHIWNSYFINSTNRRPEYLLQFYEEIEKNLFCAIVLANVESRIPSVLYRDSALPYIQVIPAKPGHEFTAYSGRTSPDGNVYWKRHPPILMKSEMHFHFYDFFNWGSYGFLDYPLVRCVLTENQAEQFGGDRLVLVEQSTCVFLFDEGAML